MPRSTSRARLENGIKLDINRLARQGFIKRGASTRPIGISWNSDYWGEIARGLISADMSSQFAGSLTIQLGSIAQQIALRAQPRRYGGVQWYFICPATGRTASVLWRMVERH